MVKNRSMSRFKLAPVLTFTVICSRKISDLKVFLHASAGHWKWYGGSYVVRGPIIAYPSPSIK